jgi:arsenate reductase
MREIFNVLFLCIANSARSILAEALVDRWGLGQFKGYSAGSRPKGEVHSMALAALGLADIPIGGLASKHWDVFAQPAAPRMDFVITVCDQPAGEICPVWPGHPITATWALPDPAAVKGTAKHRQEVFNETFRILEARVQMLVALRLSDHDRDTIERRLHAIDAYYPQPQSVARLPRQGQPT